MLSSSQHRAIESVGGSACRYLLLRMSELQIQGRGFTQPYPWQLWCLWKLKERLHVLRLLSICKVKWPSGSVLATWRRLLPSCGSTHGNCIDMEIQGASVAICCELLSSVLGGQLEYALYLLIDGQKSH